MNRTLLFIVGAAFLLAESAFAQTPSGPPPDRAVQEEAQSAGGSLFVELGGSALFYSVNYEFLLPSPQGNVWVAGRVGFMYWGGYKATFGIPLIVAVLIGPSSHKLEFGGGRVFGQGYDLDYPPGWTGVLGYRYQRKEGGLMFRLSFTPVVSDPTRFGDRDTAAWGGISIGIGF